MCDFNSGNGIVRDCYYYCNDTCYQNKMFFSNLSQPQTQVRPKPQETLSKSTKLAVPPVDKIDCRRDGTCATCKNTYKYCGTAVEKEGMWFCGNTCSTVYQSSQRVSQFPAFGFPFASNMQTFFPISVNARTGKMVF
jgi:hypothetical protein